MDTASKQMLADVSSGAALLSDQRPAKSDDEIVDETLSPEVPGTKVAILLGALNGQRFLPEQLDSIRNQDHPDWMVWASDDSSSDNTKTILDQFSAQWGEDRLNVRSGPENGFVSNFLSLVCDPAIEADYFAFCDQDDVWEANKLTRALQWLETVTANIPALYCSRAQLIDESSRVFGYSPLYKVPPTFANALVQNIAGGNTMVMNKAARDLLRAAGDKVQVVYHDWWTYLLVTGAGGEVFYDSEPAVKYRQHIDNMIGSNTSWLARLFRVRMLLKGRFRKWNDLNTEALLKNRNCLTPENQQTLSDFCLARRQSLIPRIRGIYKSGVHRQTFIGNLGLVAATLLRKI